MMQETLQSTIYNIINILAITTAYYAGKTVFTLHTKKTKAAHKIEKMMLLIALGFLLWGLAELSWSIIEVMFQQDPEQGIPDILWTLGYIGMMSGFAWLVTYTKQQETTKETPQMLSVIIASAIAAYIITKPFVATNLTLIETLIYYGYPIASAITATLCYINKKTFEGQQIATAFNYLMLCLIFSLAGDILYSYYSSFGEYGIIGITSDTLYAFSYWFSTIAFYKITRKK